MPTNHSSSSKVTFPPLPATYSRLPHDDEAYVLRRFARHIAACCTTGKCNIPARTLCGKGHQRARDVAEYIFSAKDGLAFFSVVDLNEGRRMQVEIPSDCAASVKELLRAVERGKLRLGSSSSSGSSSRKTTKGGYLDLEADLEYETSPSTSPSSPRYEYAYETVEPAAGRHKHKHHHHHSSPSSSGSRGKQHHHHHHHHSHSHGQGYPSTSSSSSSMRQPTYYTIGSRGALPVPSTGWYY